MSSRGKCLVCGRKEDEVDRLHYFPSNPNKSRVWEERMGIKNAAKLSLRNNRICSIHFTPECYRNPVTYKLTSIAIPSLFSATPVDNTPVRDVRSGTQEEVVILPGCRDAIPEEITTTSTAAPIITEPTPSTSAELLMTPGVTILEETLESTGGILDVAKKVSQLLKTNIDFSWLNCSIHKKLVIEAFATAICKIGIPWWCKRRLQLHRQQRKDSRESRKKKNLLINNAHHSRIKNDLLRLTFK